MAFSVELKRNSTVVDWRRQLCWVSRSRCLQNLRGRVAVSRLSKLQKKIAIRRSLLVRPGRRVIGWVEVPTWVSQ